MPWRVARVWWRLSLCQLTVTALRRTNMVTAAMVTARLRVRAGDMHTATAVTPMAGEAARALS